MTAHPTFPGCVSVRYGLTGGIASGKSAVAEMLVDRGVAVVDADRIAREVVAPGQNGLAAVVAEFGQDILLDSGELDRVALGRIVFADDEARFRLNAIIHPPVRQEMAAAAKRHEDAGHRLIVMDVPLLYETGDPGEYAGVMVVYVDEATQIRRLMARDGLDLEEARARLEAQMPLVEKARRASCVIDNSRTLANTERQVVSWLRALRGEHPEQ